MITARGTGSDDADEQRHAANACSILALVNAASPVNAWRSPNFLFSVPTKSVQAHPGDPAPDYRKIRPEVVVFHVDVKCNSRQNLIITSRAYANDHCHSRIRVTGTDFATFVLRGLSSFTRNVDKSQLLRGGQGRAPGGGRVLAESRLGPRRGRAAQLWILKSLHTTLSADR